MPTMQRSHGDGRQGRERLAPGLPAQHRRRLVHAGDGHLAGRARLDEQHVLPHRRGQLQQLARASRRPASSRPTTSPRPPSARARRVVVDGVGGHARLVPALQGPVVDFRTFFSAAASSSTTTSPASRPAPTRSASRTSGSTLADAAGWTNVPASFSPAQGGAVHARRTRSPGDANVTGLRPLHLRLDGRRRRPTTTAC